MNGCVATKSFADQGFSICGISSGTITLPDCLYHGQRHLLIVGGTSYSNTVYPPAGFEFFNCSTKKTSSYFTVTSSSYSAVMCVYGSDYVYLIPIPTV